MDFMQVLKRGSTFLGLFFLWLIVGFYPATQYTTQQQFFLFNQFHHASLDFVFPYITYLGDGFGVVLVVIVLLFVKYRFSLIVGLAGATTGIIVQLLKNFVFNHIHRPYFYFKNHAEAHFIPSINLHEHFSFPSGHATSSFALFFSLALILKNKWAQMGFFFIALISAYSRVYIGQHFYQDIYIGSIIGVAGALIVYWFLAKPNQKFQQLNKSLIDVAISRRKGKKIS